MYLYRMKVTGVIS